MKSFALLFDALDRALFPDQKVSALVRYFRQASARDAAWALHLLMRKRLPRIVTNQRLRTWVGEETGWREWMLDECHDSVGDWAETAHLLLPETSPGEDDSLHELIEQKLLPLVNASGDVLASRTKKLWRELAGTARYVSLKMMLGGLRMPVSPELLAQALAELRGLAFPVVLFRLSRCQEFTPASFERLLRPSTQVDAVAVPFPFRQAMKKEVDSWEEGFEDQWQAEWQYEGLRVQVIRREGMTLLWAHPAKVVNASFSTLTRASEAFPDGTVVDGVIVVREGNEPGPADLLKRGELTGSRGSSGRCAFVLMVFDLLEEEGQDLRAIPLNERRRRLETLLQRVDKKLRKTGRNAEPNVQGDLFSMQSDIPGPCPIRLSEVLEVENAEGLDGCLGAARAAGASGVVLKRVDSAYDAEGGSEEWIQIAAEPFVHYAVLIAAQKGSGKKASLYVHYYFGVCLKGEWVSVASVRGGLGKKEETEIDQFVRSNTIGRHGPLRSVRPELVFMLHHEGVSRSKRHRSGVVLRSARIAAWCRDRTVEQADGIETLRC